METGFEWTKFLKGWGALIVATVALIQPWIQIILNRIRGGIDIYETGTIEIAYSSLGGPIIGLHGTLRAIYQDQFVRSMGLTVIKHSDNSRHAFEWGMFRGNKTDTSSTQPAVLEIPYGFLVSTNQPHRYNIVFFDTAIQEEMRPHLQQVRQEWNKELQQKVPLIQDLASATQRNTGEQNTDLQQGLNALFEHFSKKQPSPMRTPE